MPQPERLTEILVLRGLKIKHLYRYDDRGFTAQVYNLNSYTSQIVKGFATWNKTERTLFHREATLLSNFAGAGIHSSFPALTHSWIEPDYLILSYDFIEGTPLNDALRSSGEISLATVSQQLLLRLAALHSQGIVHGQVQVENIILLPDGGVSLVGFGLHLRRKDFFVDGIFKNGNFCHAIRRDINAFAVLLDNLLKLSHNEEIVFLRSQLAQLLSANLMDLSGLLPKPLSKPVSPHTLKGGALVHKKPEQTVISESDHGQDQVFSMTEQLRSLFDRIVSWISARLGNGFAGTTLLKTMKNRQQITKHQKSVATEEPVKPRSAASTSSVPFKRKLVVAGFIMVAAVLIGNYMLNLSSSELSASSVDTVAVKDSDLSGLEKEMVRDDMLTDSKSPIDAKALMITENPNTQDAEQLAILRGIFDEVRSCFIESAEDAEAEHESAAESRKDTAICLRALMSADSPLQAESDENIWLDFSQINNLGDQHSLAIVDRQILGDLLFLQLKDLLNSSASQFALVIEPIGTDWLIRSVYF